MRKNLFVMFSIISVLLISACSDSSSFDGSRSGNDSQLVMRYHMFDTTDTQFLELDKDDILEVKVVSNAGKVSASIQKDKDKPIYQEEDISTGDFKVEIKASGTYKVNVIGEKAEGSISFIKAKNT